MWCQMNQLGNATMRKRAIRWLLAGLVALMSASCGGGGSPEGGGGAFPGSVGGSSGGGGAGGGATTTSPQFLYVTDPGSGQVAGYVVNPLDGKLTLVVNTPWAAGTTPKAIVVNPAGTYAYVANADGDAVNTTTGSVSGYRINRTTGELIALGGSLPIAAGLNPSAIAMDPLGQYVYVLNEGSGTVSGYTISTDTSTAGQLIPMAGSPWLTTALAGPPEPGPISLAVDPLGRFVYVANFAVDSIAVFSIDAGTGGLTQLDVVAMPSSGEKPHAIAVDPAGGSVYVVNENTKNIIRFLISESTPWLVPEGGGVTLSTGDYPYSVVVSPNGGNIYATNFLDGTISAYQVNSLGVLSHLGVRPPCKVVPAPKVWWSI